MEYEIVAEDNEKSLEDLLDISSIEELFEGDERDFYTVMLRRYSDEIQQGISADMGYMDEDFDTGEQELVLYTQEERRKTLLSKALNEGILKGKSGLETYEIVDIYSKAIDNGSIHESFISEIPVLFVDQASFATSDFQDSGAVKLNDATEINLAGIVVFLDGSEEFSFDTKKEELQHEFVHVCNSILKEKFALEEANENKRALLWRFIDEMLAYGTNVRHLEEVVSSLHELDSYFFYVSEDDPNYDDVAEISREWEGIIEKVLLSDERDSELQNIRAYIIKEAKQFSDIDLRIPSTAEKLHQYIHRNAIKRDQEQQNLELVKAAEDEEKKQRLSNLKRIL